MPTRPLPHNLSRPLARRAVVAAVAAASLAGLMTGPARAGGGGGEGGDGGSVDRELQRRLQAFVATPGGPPGAIAVLTADGHSEVYRAGTAEVGTGRPPRTTDHMRIASVAKAFSGAVALHLADRGRISLDDALGRWLPRLPTAWHRVTVAQLLDHTSGLPDYTESPTFIEEFAADPRRRFDSRTLLRYVAGEPLRFRPGSAYRYSNSDNIAVALIAEAATGTRYEQLLDEIVYRPLGLRATSLPQGYRLPRPYLHGYAVDPPSPPEDLSTAISASGVWASGGIVSTPGTWAPSSAPGPAAGAWVRRSVSGS